jgi:outer membrane lipoprotein-sorting protein
MARTHIGLRIAGMLVTAVAAIGLLAGCETSVSTGGTAVGTAVATATPSAASILLDAQKVKINDATLDFSVSGTASGKQVTGNGILKLTASPKRTDANFTMRVDGTQIVFESISDVTTDATYTKFSQPAILATGKWVKQSVNFTSFVNFSQLTDYSSVKNATLVGPDTVNGVSVWHLRANRTENGQNITADLYFSQKDYHPVKITGTSAGSVPFTMTITYTAINSGIKIALPPASEVQST